MSTSLSLEITQLPPIPLPELTTADVNGTGAFDVLMRAMAGHLTQEHKRGTITGPNYSSVYLGGLTQVLQSAVDFLTNGRKAQLEALLIAKQIELAEVEKDKALVELQILREQANKIPYEIQLLQAQIELTQQQALNAEKEREVLAAQICKLKGEYQLILAQIEKAAQENELIKAKVVTEKAQTSSIGVDPRSVIGRQTTLYAAQTAGFKRDAEQKTAKIMIDTWNVRRTTDSDATPADQTNKLHDSFVGQAVNLMLEGASQSMVD